MFPHQVGGFSLIKFLVFPPRFFIKFRRFFHQLNKRFPPQSPTGFRKFSLSSYDLKRLHTCWSSHLRGKAIVMSWSHVTSYMIDLTRLGQIQIITDPNYPQVDLVISHLTYLINLPTFGSIFWINLLNQLTESAFSLNWWQHWFVVRRLF